MHSTYIISVEVLSNFQLKLFFEDGKSGIIDMHKYLWGEAFEELKKPDYFKKVVINDDLGTICWPNGVEIAPESLYKEVLSHV